MTSLITLYVLLKPFDPSLDAALSAKPPARERLLYELGRDRLNANSEQIAARLENSYTVSMLEDALAAGWQPKETLLLGPYKMTLLHYATSYRSTFAVSALIRLGHDPNYRGDGRMASIPVFRLARRDIGILDTLLDGGMDINFGGRGNFWPLMSTDGRPDIALYLLLRGADPNRYFVEGGKRVTIIDVWKRNDPTNYSLYNWYRERGLQPILGESRYDQTIGFANSRR